MCFNNVMKDINDNIYTYGLCPKCNEHCDDEMPCWLDTLSQLKCDPEWIMTYGSIYKNSNCLKHSWHSMWKTGKHIKPEMDIGDYSWLVYLIDDNPN